MCVVKAGKWARCPYGQRQAAAIALRDACSGIGNTRHTHTLLFDLLAEVRNLPFDLLAEARNLFVQLSVEVFLHAPVIEKFSNSLADLSVQELVVGIDP